MDLVRESSAFCAPVITLKVRHPTCYDFDLDGPQTRRFSNWGGLLNPNIKRLNNLKKLSLAVGVLTASLITFYLIFSIIPNLEQTDEISPAKQILDKAAPADQQVEASYDVFVKEYQQQLTTGQSQSSEQTQASAPSQSISNRAEAPAHSAQAASLQSKPKPTESAQNKTPNSERLESRLNKIDNFIAEHHIVEQLNAQNITDAVRKKYFWLFEERTRILMLLAEIEIANTDRLIKERHR